MTWHQRIVGSVQLFMRIWFELLVTQKKKYLAENKIHFVLFNIQLLNTSYFDYKYEFDTNFANNSKISLLV